MRAFIAIDCDEIIKENIASFLKKLDSGAGNVRWIKKSGMHLTLKFLGEIREVQIEDIRHGIRRAVEPFKPFELILEGTGSFPPTSRFPKVLWVGVKENRILNDLQQDIEQSLFQLGFSKEMRPYRPHLTLGRVKKREGLGPILDIVRENREKSFGRMNARQVTLFRSTLKPDGAEYTAISEFNIQ